MNKVSVIVPTCKDRRGKMENCLVSIAMSNYPNIEIITVDEGLERSTQRNHGMKDAKGDYILYLDDDQYISDKLIWECVNLMQNYDALYIPEVIVTNNWFGRLRNWERRFYTETCVDCIRFFKKKELYFDETMSGPEDADFDHRYAGRRTVTKNCLYHDDDIGFIEYMKKKIYYTRSMETYKKRWPDDKVLDWKYRCCGIFIEKGKWRWLLEKPHYTVLLGALIFVRGLAYLCRKR